MLVERGAAVLRVVVTQCGATALHVSLWGVERVVPGS